MAKRSKHVGPKAQPMDWPTWSMITLIVVLAGLMVGGLLKRSYLG